MASSPAKVVVRLTGIGALEKALKSGGERALKLAATALYHEAEAIMTDSKENYCPKDLGNLYNSGHVQPPKIQGKKVDVEMGYGGPAADYALIVHEWLDPKVHWSIPGTGPKYLEKPILAAAPGMANRLANYIKAGM
ncbi:MAG: hypothetical protein ACM3US_09805 [Sphingomonadaceae bacterium]